MEGSGTRKGGLSRKERGGRGNTSQAWKCHSETHSADGISNDTKFAKFHLGGIRKSHTEEQALFIHCHPQGPASHESCDIWWKCYLHT